MRVGDSNASEIQLKESDYEEEEEEERVNSYRECSQTSSRIIEAQHFYAERRPAHLARGPLRRGLRGADMERVRCSSIGGQRAAGSEEVAGDRRGPGPRCARSTERTPQRVRTTTRAAHVEGRLDLSQESGRPGARAHRRPGQPRGAYHTLQPRGSRCRQSGGQSDSSANSSRILLDLPQARYQHVRRSVPGLQQVLPDAETAASWTATLDVGGRGECLAMDIVGGQGSLPQTARANTYILTMIDCFTCFAVAVPLSNQSLNQSFLQYLVITY